MSGGESRRFGVRQPAALSMKGIESGGWRRRTPKRFALGPGLSRARRSAAAPYSRSHLTIAG
jgi:hypothetical protein